MKKYLLIGLLLILVSPMAMSASSKEPTKRDRQQWFKEMQQYKHDFLSKELDLSQEQQDKFFPVYDRMEQEKHALDKQTRQMEREIEKKGDTATDLEYEKAAEAAFELDGKKNDIEIRYFKEFKTILSKKQLFKLKCAERKFTRVIMQHRAKAKDKKQE